MSKEKYILNVQIHFGSLKTSVQKGSIVFWDKEKKQVEINGVSHDDVKEIEMCIEKGFIVPFTEGETKIDTEVKISPKAKEKKMAKLQVEKSDLDSMKNEILVPKSKKEQREKDSKKELKVIRESFKGEERGIKVVSNQDNSPKEVDSKQMMEIINGMEGQVVKQIPAKEVKKPKGVPETKTDLTINNVDENVINQEQGVVVKTIGKAKNTKQISSKNKLVAKKSSKTSEDKAKANAQARKKASEARRAKNKGK